MPEEEMMNGAEVKAEGETTEESPEAEITQAVADCFAEGGDAYGTDKDTAIDAVITKLEAMKTGTGGLKGLGEEGGMELPEEEGEDD